jgi:DNA-binding phage protein
MLRDQINAIMVRWGPKERKGSDYDPVIFLETPEQARKLIRHLKEELSKARQDRNFELVSELRGVLARVDSLSKRLTRWEQRIDRAVKAQEVREIRKLPLGF